MADKYQRVALGENVVEMAGTRNGEIVLPSIQISEDGQTLLVSIPIKTTPTGGKTDNIHSIYSERDIVSDKNVYSDNVSVMFFGTAESASRLMISANLKSKVPESGGF